MSGKTVLYRSSNKFGETALLALFQFFVKSWNRHVEQLIIARDERAVLVTRAKNDGVPCGTSGDWTTELSLEQPQVNPRLHWLEAQRSYGSAASMAPYRKEPGERTLSQSWRFILHCQCLLNPNH